MWSQVGAASGITLHGCVRLGLLPSRATIEGDRCAGGFDWDWIFVEHVILKPLAQALIRFSERSPYAVLHRSAVGAEKGRRLGASVFSTSVPAKVATVFFHSLL